MPQRVLLIDDAPQVQRLVQAWLGRDGIDVAWARCGQEGVEVASQVDFDVILLDIDMPDISGFDVCRQLKSDARLSDVPIVFLTGASSPEDRVAGLNLGAVDYIIKPFHPAEFLARVRAALRTKHLLDLLRERAQIDGLTALHNRAYLDKRLDAELAALARRPGSLSCVIADVDNFKAVNDKYGHLVGDEVLRAVAAVLQGATRTEDVVARYGGEEFVVLTPGVGEAGAVALAERLREQIEAASVHRISGSISVTCSFGVASHDPAAPGELLHHADLALYEAKRAGRNRVRGFEAGLYRAAAERAIVSR